jgi:hypothetical protein
MSSYIKKSRVRGFDTVRLGRIRTHRNNAGVITDLTTIGQGFRLGGSYETVTTSGHKGPPYNEGGPFRLDRYSIRRQSNGLSVYVKTQIAANHTLEERIDGAVIAGLTSNNIAVSTNDGLPVGFSKADLLAKYNSMSLPSKNLETIGTAFIRNLSPVKPGANIGQMYAELMRDGLPHLPVRLKNQVRDFRLNGGNYLNIQFGWRPLLKDLQDLYKTWLSLDSRVRQLIRDNGRPIRRKGRLSPVITNTTEDLIALGTGTAKSSLDGFELFSVDPSYTGPVYAKKTVQTSEEIWFKGRFRYYIPELSPSQWDPKVVSQLFGLNPSPSLLYEILPWSWLIDWFLNVGDVLANLSRAFAQNQVVDYAYVMRHFKRETTYTVRTAPLIRTTNADPLSVNGYYPAQTFTTVVVEESKERVVSTPFGFGVTTSGLSAQQVAILTALDLSRGKHNTNLFARFYAPLV